MFPPALIIVTVVGCNPGRGGLLMVFRPRPAHYFQRGAPNRVLHFSCQTLRWSLPLGGGKSIGAECMGYFRCGMHGVFQTRSVRLGCALPQCRGMILSRSRNTMEAICSVHLGHRHTVFYRMFSFFGRCLPCGPGQTSPTWALKRPLSSSTVMCFFFRVVLTGLHMVFQLAPCRISVSMPDAVESSQRQNDHAATVLQCPQHKP